MDEDRTYTECLEEYMREEGLDPSWAAEICSKAEGPRADEESKKSSGDERWDFYGDL